MDEFTPNSHKYKESLKNPSDERIINKVTVGPTKVQKKNEMSKLADVFISEDVKNVKQYVLMDVLVPTIKKAIVDIVSDGINMIFFGGTGSRRSTSSGSKVSYSSFYSHRDDRRDTNQNSSGTRFDYDDIVFKYRGDAEALLDEMSNVIERYGFVTVLDMYDIVEKSVPHTAAKYGWTSVASAEIRRVRDGWVIKLPKARPIDS